VRGGILQPSLLYHALRKVKGRLRVHEHIGKVKVSAFGTMLCAPGKMRLQGGNSSIGQRKEEASFSLP